ncbi:MAG: ribosomal protein S18-alanine N-acetyltransferase [Cocleimonas sp.]|nr:ribosomal protein S18-alanine N-acetyltransferase [Cocleimonas sp.]
MIEKRVLKYLRKMVHADLTKVMQGELASYPYPWTLGNFEDCLRNRRMYSCWVFEFDNEFAGHVVISAGAGEAHILNICVYPEEQGKGWGRKLLAEAEWIAKQHRADTCILEVRPSNHVGIRLYQSEGYNEIGLRKDYYPADKGREDAIVMAKTLF